MAPQTPAGVEELSSLVDDAAALITGFEKSLKDVVDSNGDSGPSTSEASVQDRKQLDALALARDVATLIKAHSTKISLFIINEPYTPSAISAVLKQLIEGPIPAIATAVQQCHADLFTKLIRRDLAWRCGRVLKELRELIGKIPKDGKVVPQDKRNGLSHGTAEKGSITTTGLLWTACDEVVSFANLGVAGHLAKRAEEFRDLLKDVLDELKDWSDEQEVDGDEDQDAGNEAVPEYHIDEYGVGVVNPHITAQAMLDEFMNTVNHIPRDDPDKIKVRLDSTLRRLRLTALLYQALIKRRLKTLPKLPLASADTGSVVVSRLDEVVPLLRRITDRFNSLAVAFYELDSAEITKLMDQCFFDAFAVSELLAKPWDGQRDEFTDWVAKFQVEIKKS